MVMKAKEISELTNARPSNNIPYGLPRNWWIGLTDEYSEGRFYWPYSLKEVNFTAWARGPEAPKNDLNLNYVHLSLNADYQWSNVNDFGNGGENAEFTIHNSPICQLILTEQ